MASKARDTVLGIIIIAVAAWGIFGRSESDRDSAGASSAPKVAATAPLSANDIAVRVSTLRNVSNVQPPSSDTGNLFTLSVTANSVHEAGSIAMDALHSIHNHIGSSPYAGASITVIVPLRDRYGRVTNAPLIKLGYKADDIDKIVFDNITTFDILNLADVKLLDAEAPRLLGEDCREKEALAKYAGPFCIALVTATAPP